MWSPDSRKLRASELKSLADRITRYRQLTDRFAGYFKPESDSARSLLELRHHAGLSFKQISDLLDEPVGTLLARHHRVVRGAQDRRDPGAGAAPTGDIPVSH